MTVVNNMITKASEDELHAFYLEREYDDLYSFPDFLEKMKRCGVEIVKEKTN